jgi:acyl-coenzyme A thioesterase PaaI-like protein
MDEIRRRVLRGIALNREPGFHFAGNFLGIELLEVGERTRVAMEPGAHVEERDGQVHVAPVFMAADIALAASIRSQLAPSTRLATVSMHLQLNGAPLKGTIEARGEYHGFTSGAQSRLGLARVTITAGGQPVGFGHGSFMALDPPPGMTMHPVAPTRRHDVELPAEESLDEPEREILRRADAALGTREDVSFIARFLGIVPRKTGAGASCPMENGAHVGNRVGHAQGGILMGLAAATASAALGPEWLLAAVAASFVSPGEGAVLEASSSVVHRGRWTAVGRTQVIGAAGRRVLEVVTNHARRPE